MTQLLPLLQLQRRPVLRQPQLPRKPPLPLQTKPLLKPPLLRLPRKLLSETASKVPPKAELMIR